MIVVLVILAILAAILVPALLGWIDKAKEKQVVLDARSAYLAAQTLASEEYGKKSPDKTKITNSKIMDLADLPSSDVWVISWETGTGRDAWTIKPYSYTDTSASKTVYYDDGEWTSTAPAAKGPTS